jgi:uncharacterized protein (TIGR03435 family)
MGRRLSILLAAIFAATSIVPLLGQAASDRKPVAFEVVSIKPNINGGGSEFDVAPGRLHATNRTVSDLIFHAYNLRPYQIPEKPDWTHAERYDVEAKAGGNLGWAETMPMLQSLLEDRFKLKSHWDTTDRPVFFLMTAKGGIKLKASTATCFRFDPRAAKAETSLPVCKAGQVYAGGETRRWVAEKADINDVTYVLSLLLGRKVIDKTEFTGRFDFSIEFAPDPLKADGNVPPLLTVLQDELGLTVDSGKAPVEVLVIDHVERPSPD